MTCACHAFRVVDPALVDLLGILPDVRNRLVVIEALDPIHIFRHVVRPVPLLVINFGLRVGRVNDAAPDQGGDLIDKLKRQSLGFCIASKPRQPEDCLLYTSDAADE